MGEIHSLRPAAIDLLLSVNPLNLIVFPLPFFFPSMTPIGVVVGFGAFIAVLSEMESTILVCTILGTSLAQYKSFSVGDVGEGAR
jgi:hypothetical protein